MNFFSRAWSAAFGSLKNVFSFLLPFAQSELGRIANDLLPVALDIVTEVQKSSAPDKYKAALNKLEAAVLAEGKTVPQRVINWTLETAVIKLKTPTS